MGFDFVFTDRSNDVIAELNRKLPFILEEIGLKAEGFTKANITAAGREDTGQYRNSITHRVKPDEKAVYIGSNLEHAIYNELGTGKFASNGSGRPGWWVYVAGQSEASRAAHRATTRRIYTFEQAKQIVAMLRAKGLDARMTQGMKPIHALQKAASEHNNVYKNIFKRKLQE